MFALKFWARQSRRASFRLLSLALILAVAAMTSVGVFSARLEAALVRDANHLLGGDLVISSKRDVQSAEWFKFLNPLPSGIQSASSVVFPSVVSTGNQELLVSLKAVSGTYPLRGELFTTDPSQAQPGPGLAQRSGPPVGEVWVDEAVLSSLGAALGDYLTIGEVRLKLGRVILVEPDRSPGFVNFAPRVMLNLQDLESTRLLGPGSRATWRIYLAGGKPEIQKVRSMIEPLLSTTEQLESVESGRPEVSSTLNRARDFLAMSALIGTLVACVGIGLVANLFAREQRAELALLKSLGFTPRQLLRLWISGLLGITLLTGLLGVILGWFAHWGLMALLADLVGVRLPMAGLVYLPLGVGLAGFLLLGFAAVPAWAALQAPAISVLRQQALGNERTVLVFSCLFGVLTAMLLCVLTVSNFTLAISLLAGFVGVSLLFAAVFWFLLKGLARIDHLRTRSGRVVGVAVFQSMSKRSASLIVQGVSLSLGLTALMVLAVVQGDLIERWQAVVPKDAPNRFVFNIQPEQVKGLKASLEKTLGHDVQLYPMVRGRLSEIRGEALRADTFANPDAKRMVEREFNLSFAEHLPKGNRLIKGKWFEGEGLAAELSLEESVAKRLNIALGDELTFDIAGIPLKAKVASIRDLRWDSMEVNFYVIFPMQALGDLPQTWITAFYVKPELGAGLSRDLLKAYSNLTVLDTGLVINQIRKILAQVSQAVQFVFVFTLFAGGLVLVACVMTGARSRTREAAIYRALGASSSQLQRASWLELATVGALAGLVSSLTAQAVGWSLARYVFEFDYLPTLLPVLTGIAAGLGVSILFGSWSVRKVCKAPVWATLRQVGT